MTACTTRPLQPAPPLYATWAKAGVTEQGVRHALLDCGFPDAAHVTTETLSTNDYARGQICMLDRGFTYNDRSIVCTHAPDLPACANVPRGKTFGTDPDFDPALLDQRPKRPPAYTRWTRPDTDVEAVKRTMTACGYTDVVRPGDMMKSNDHAAAQLCMLDKKFQYGYSANSLLCKSSPALPACRGRAVR